MPIGARTTQVSTREELLKEKVTSGVGDPQHTPEVPAQTYFDINGTGYYVWKEGVWTSELVLTEA